MATGQSVAVRDISNRSMVGADSQGMRRVGLVKPTANPAEIVEAHKQIATMVSEVLEKNIDYGEIPGTDGKKALLKAGAERLAFSIGASIELEIMEKEIDHHIAFEWSKKQKQWKNDKGRKSFTWVETVGTSRGIYRYVVKARLVRREDGAVLGEGVGSCSSLEAKYVDRPRDSENTILKMAKKRASVDAVLTTMALTGRFAPEEAADDDEDGVVADPTDGLTLEEALEYPLNKVALGTMRPKSLSGARTYCDGKLQEDPESASLLRLSAMIDMVMKFRAEHPLAVDTKPAAAAPAASTPAATEPAVGADSDDPFA